jgi:hypothetical protein
MRDTIAQRGNTMIPIAALRKPSRSHVRHAETGGFIRAANLERNDEASGVPYEGQRCALLTTKSRNTCTRATVFSSSG